jgi:hypothetical protein
VQYAPSIDALQQVFSVYGPLAKMTLANRGGCWQVGCRALRRGPITSSCIRS